MADKRKKPEPDDPEQSQRFIEAAKDREAEDDGDRFDHIVQKAMPKQSGVKILPKKK